MTLAVAEEHKGEDLLLLDMRRVTLVADYFVLVTGRNLIHIDTLADALDERLTAAGCPLRHREGRRRAHWTLLDFGDVVAHLFTAEERRYYDLERLWGDAPVVNRDGIG
ncbi:MAG: ribosome silencing factor [Clostridia bacterium]